MPVGHAAVSDAQAVHIDAGGARPRQIMVVILNGVAEAIRRAIDKIPKVYIIIRERGGWQEPTRTPIRGEDEPDKTA
jgi:hypothetical protein